MQPSFRRPEDSSALMPLRTLVAPDQEKDHWAPLRKAGDSGFFSLIMLLSLWGVAAKTPSRWDEPSDPTWEQVVCDVITCIPHITLVPEGFSKKAVKRGGADDHGETAGPRKK